MVLFVVGEIYFLLGGESQPKQLRVGYFSDAARSITWWTPIQEQRGDRI